MAKSSLAKLKVPADKSNYTKSRYLDYYDALKLGVKPEKLCTITEITIHHMAGVASAENCGYGFQNPNRNGSAHYGIGNDGEIACYVDENDTAWANSDWAANCRAVTIETSNSKYGDEHGWPVSDAALKSLIKLVADIAKRNKLGKLVKGENLTWHQMYGATACPGPYLLGKMDYIVAEANKLNGEAVVVEGDPKAWSFPYESDTQRTTNKLVLYTQEDSTGTNKWGTECLLSKDGVVLDKVSGVGNHPRKGLRVLSGHGTADLWLNKIKVGYHVYFSKGLAYIDSGVYRTIDGVNTTRGADMLIKYTKAFKNNKYGYLVAVDKNGVVLANPRYGIESLPIPEGGYVLSAHGASAKWLVANVRAGMKITKIGSNSIKIN